MTYQSASTLHKEFISLVISKNKRKLNKKNSNQTGRTLPLVIFREGGHIFHKKRDLPVIPPDLHTAVETSPGTNGMPRNLHRPASYVFIQFLTFEFSNFFFFNGPILLLSLHLQLTHLFHFHLK